MRELRTSMWRLLFGRRRRRLRHSPPGQSDPSDCLYRRPRCPLPNSRQQPTSEKTTTRSCLYLRPSSANATPVLQLCVRNVDCVDVTRANNPGRYPTNGCVITIVCARLTPSLTMLRVCAALRVCFTTVQNPTGVKVVQTIRAGAARNNGRLAGVALRPSPSCYRACGVIGPCRVAKRPSRLVMRDIQGRAAAADLPLLPQKNGCWTQAQTFRCFVISPNKKVITTTTTSKTNSGNKYSSSINSTSGWDYYDFSILHRVKHNPPVLFKNKKFVSNTLSSAPLKRKQHKTLSKLKEMYSSGKASYRKKSFITR